MGLRAAGWRVVWGNQWEPATRAQPAFDCYARRFKGTHSNEDIAVVLRRVADGLEELPDAELVVGGFPCQDYSVAKPRPQAHGIEGKKGVLWWEINRLLELCTPPLVFLENVDRLLKSPASRRGRDFAVMLSCLTRLGYEVEWRVVNAADYGAAQRRRRVYIVAYRPGRVRGDSERRIHSSGVLARAFPVKGPGILAPEPDSLRLSKDPYHVSQTFPRADRPFRFENAGVCFGGVMSTKRVEEAYSGPRLNLDDVLLPDGDVDEAFFIPEDRVPSWRYLKGAKAEPRKHKGTGLEYRYTEGSLPFPDPLDRPARTVLTGEGGTSPSRFKHVVEAADGRFRRLTPVELERVNGFPDRWTETGMSDGKRAFCMGNALVVPMIERVGWALADPKWRADRVEAARRREKRARR